MHKHELNKINNNLNSESVDSIFELRPVLAEHDHSNAVNDESYRKSEIEQQKISYPSSDLKQNKNAEPRIHAIISTKTETALKLIKILLTGAIFSLPILHYQFLTTNSAGTVAYLLFYSLMVLSTLNADPNWFRASWKSILMIYVKAICIIVLFYLSIFILIYIVEAIIAPLTREIFRPPNFNLTFLKQSICAEPRFLFAQYISIPLCYMIGHQVYVCKKGCLKTSISHISLIIIGIAIFYFFRFINIQDNPLANTGKNLLAIFPSALIYLGLSYFMPLRNWFAHDKNSELRVIIFILCVSGGSLLGWVISMQDTFCIGPRAGSYILNLAYLPFLCLVASFILFPACIYILNKTTFYFALRVIFFALIDLFIIGYAIGGFIVLSKGYLIENIEWESSVIALGWGIMCLRWIRKQAADNEEVYVKDLKQHQKNYSDLQNNELTGQYQRRKEFIKNTIESNSNIY